MQVTIRLLSVLIVLSCPLLAGRPGAPPGVPAPYQEAPIQVAALDGSWDLLLDPEDVGRGAGWERGGSDVWAKALQVRVPGILESLTTTAGYDGVVWYRRRLPAVKAPPAGGGRVFLTFDSVNYRADVWIGQTHLGRHDGSDAPFRFDVTGLLEQADRWLVVRCVDPGQRQADGLLLGALPHAKESWYYNYGGITGSVRLETVPRLELKRHTLRVDANGEVRIVLDWVNHDASERAVDLSLVITAGDDTIVGCSHPRVLQPGPSRLDLPLDGADTLERWSPEHPALHPLTVLVRDGRQVVTWSLRVGLRTFAVRDTHFVLDGQPVYLRGVLYQPYYPRGLALPPHPEFLRDDLQAIRDAGFNLVRMHLRTQPAVYALCDEIGLFVQAEPTLGWITSEQEETAEAVDSALVALADAVAGHPSVVMVGVLNELSGELYRNSDALLARAVELMPERLILEDSGSWQGTTRYVDPSHEGPVEYDDLHVYRAWPWNADDAQWVRSLGAEHERLIYVSEYGFGGIPSFGANLAGFGSALHLEDAKDYAADLRRVLASIRLAPKGVALPDAHSVSLAGQINQARAARFMAASLRANPRVAGDCYTQWRDAAWENGAGLCDVWGNPKPAHEVFAELNALPGRPADPFSGVTAPLPKRPTRPVARGSMVALDPAVEAVVAPLLSGAAHAMFLPRLVVMGFRPALWGPENLNSTVALLRFARDGGTVLMLDPPDAGRPLPQLFFGYEGRGQVADLPFSVHARPSRGHFIGTHFLFATRSKLLDDIPRAGPLLDERFGAIVPHKVLLAGDPGRVRAELICLDGWGEYLGAAVQVVSYGAGHIVLNTLRLGTEQLDDPMAQRVLENLVRLAASVAIHSDSEPETVVVNTPRDLAADIGRFIWRHKIFFGMAERLAVQNFNGSRPARDDLPDLRAIVERKNRALDLIVTGNTAEGHRLLAQIDEGPLDDEREAFLRCEIRLSELFYGPDPESTSPRSLAQNLRISNVYLRALRLMRAGFADAAMRQLDEAKDMAAGLRLNAEEDPER